MANGLELGGARAWRRVGLGLSPSVVGLIDGRVNRRLLSVQPPLSTLVSRTGPASPDHFAAPAIPWHIISSFDLEPVELDDSSASTGPSGPRTGGFPDPGSVPEPSRGQRALLASTNHRAVSPPTSQSGNRSSSASSAGGQGSDSSNARTTASLDRLDQEAAFMGSDQTQPWPSAVASPQPANRLTPSAEQGRPAQTTGVDDRRTDPSRRPSSTQPESTQPKLVPSKSTPRSARLDGSTFDRDQTAGPPIAEAGPTDPLPSSGLDHGQGDAGVRGPLHQMVGRQSPTLPAESNVESSRLTTAGKRAPLADLVDRWSQSQPLAGPSTDIPPVSSGLPTPASDLEPVASDPTRPPSSSPSSAESISPAANEDRCDPDLLEAITLDRLETLLDEVVRQQAERHGLDWGLG